MLAEAGACHDCGGRLHQRYPEWVDTSHMGQTTKLSINHIRYLNHNISKVAAHMICKYTFRNEDTLICCVISTVAIILLYKMNTEYFQ